MNKNKIRFFAALAIVLVVYNVLAFAIPFPKNGCFWAAWVFGLVAILAQAAFLLLAFQHGDGAKSKFYGFPIARVTTIYMVIQLILSLSFILRHTFFCSAGQGSIFAAFSRRLPLLFSH